MENISFLCLRRILIVRKNILPQALYSQGTPILKLKTRTISEGSLVKPLKRQQLHPQPITAALPMAQLHYFTIDPGIISGTLNLLEMSPEHC